MGQRLDLHQILLAMVSNVYFQPPTNVRLQYPCIVYHRDFADTKFADDEPYNHTKRYQITVIDQDPDSEIPDKVAALPMSLFNRFFTADDLNHDVYNVYF
jgi:hypothetical protein